MEFKSDIQATYADSQPWEINTQTAGFISATNTIIVVDDVSAFPQGNGQCNTATGEIFRYEYAANTGASNNLTIELNDTATTIGLDSTADFSPSGVVKIQNELISYTSKSTQDTAIETDTVAEISSSDTVIPVVSTTAFNHDGLLLIQDETIYYDSIQGSELYECAIQGDLSDTDTVILLTGDNTASFPDSGIVGLGGTEYISYADRTYNTVVSEINGDIDSSETVIPLLNNGAAFPPTGYVSIDNEIIEYTSRTEFNLLGCVRGSRGTTAVAHLDGTTVQQLGSLNNCVRGLYGSSPANWPNGTIATLLPSFANCVRGYGGSTAASHVNGSHISQVTNTLDGCVRGAYGTTAAFHKPGVVVAEQPAFVNCTRGVNNTVATSLITGSYINNDYWTIQAPVRLKAISIASDGTGDGFFTLSTGSAWGADATVLLKVNIKNNTIYTLKFPEYGIIFPKGIYIYYWEHVKSTTLYTDKYSGPGLTAGN
jgi:hypothetical protein